MNNELAMSILNPGGGSTERNNIILSNSNDVMYLAECPDRRFLTYNILFVSKQVKNIFGYDPAEFSQNPGLWVKMILREDIPSMMESVSRTLDTGRASSCQYRVRPKNSEEYIWVEDSIAPLHNHGIRNGIQGIVRDINERKRFELSLKENEEKYRLLFEKVSDAIMLIDAGTFDIKEVNQAFVESYGYSTEEAQTMNAAELAADTGAAADSIRRTIIGSGDHVATAWHRKKDGTVFPVEITAGSFNLKGRRMLCAIARDISERKEFEKKLQESENKFRDLAEKSVVGIYLIQDELITYVNPVLARIFGYSIDELVGRKNPVDLVLPEDQPLSKENLQKLFSGEITSVHYEFRGMTKNQKVVFIEAYGTRTMYQGRSAVIGTLLDISERKLAEQERDQLIIDHLDALSRIKTLSGLLPICASCKKIRDDKGYWKQIESFISEHSDALFTHGICPDCAKEYYPDLFKEEKPK
jgi:PAS domain S-box-containing protein